MTATIPHPEQFPALCLAQVATLPRLRESWQATRWRDPRPGPDGETAPLFALTAEARLQALHGDLQSGRYRPRPAWRMWVPREHGAPRGVVALSITDRVVEGALLRGLRPRLDGQLTDAAFAYRQGLGALQAAQHLLDSSAGGWALRGDVAGCFDSIPHAPLLASLAGEIDGPLAALLGTVLARPVTDRSGTHRVQVGLCQGSLLAPTLCNWYLNPFDRQLAHAGLQVIRYADDFVVLAPSPEEAGRAATLAGTTLGHLGLRLNPTKTRIVSCTEGFDFLGFRFQAGDVRVAPVRLAQFRQELTHLLDTPQVPESQLRAANDLVRGWQAYYRLGSVYTDLQALDAWAAQTFPQLQGRLARFAPVPRARGSVYRLAPQVRQRQTRRGPDQDLHKVLRDAALHDLQCLLPSRPHPAFQAAAQIAARETAGLLPTGSAAVALQAAYHTVHGSLVWAQREEAAALLGRDAREALQAAGLPRAALICAADLLAQLFTPACCDTLPTADFRPVPLRWAAHLDAPRAGILSLRVALHREAHALARTLLGGAPYHPGRRL
ncbi:reverse transcriptase domain-containing protein [Deinococcus marmoris]|uniref:reverse transcriptase domain-containing protein n=1 Tax=Deinococcus marmoris TaxID=249408 RepID=UPI000496C42A|nr:reverse transcriptase domain-containing protein [Deinococcus marmoris]